MLNEDYDQIIRRVKQVQPKPISAGELTDNIMNSISELKDGKSRFILLRANQRQWLWFNGFRIITTTAAVFLIGFFLMQQKVINTKLNRLGEQVSQAQFDAGSDDGVAGFEKVNLFLPDTALSRLVDSLQTDILQVNRRSLNYMMQKIQQLENENTSFREKLQQYFTDTTMSKQINEKQ
jgi:hypothetical protein